MMFDNIIKRFNDGIASSGEVANSLILRFGTKQLSDEQIRQVLDALPIEILTSLKSMLSEFHSNSHWRPIIIGSRITDEAWAQSVPRLERVRKWCQIIY
jgi:hypothetical protein